MTRVPKVEGGFTVDRNDTFADVTCMGATCMAHDLQSDASEAEVLEAQLDYMHARDDGSVFSFLKCVRPMSLLSGTLSAAQLAFRSWIYLGLGRLVAMGAMPSCRYQLKR